MRRAAKIDGNALAIMNYLRAIPGVSVYPIKQPVDLLVSFRGKNYLMEVKDRSGRNRLTPLQKSFIASWSGQVDVVHDYAEAMLVLGLP